MVTIQNKTSIAWEVLPVRRWRCNRNGTRSDAVPEFLEGRGMSIWDWCWHMLTYVDPWGRSNMVPLQWQKITLLRNPMIVDLGSEWQCVEPSDTCPTNIMAGAMVLILQVIIRSGNWHSEWFHHDFPFQVATFQYTNLWNRPHQQRAILMFFLISLIT
jgi:hypothetical protein